MLTEYFYMNRINDAAKKLLHRQFPEHFIWNQRDKIWTTIKQGNVIGRIITVNLTEWERYYLRLLLNHVWGATSFQDLLVVNGMKNLSFRKSALLHGLFDDDNNLDLYLE